MSTRSPRASAQAATAKMSADAAAKDVEISDSGGEDLVEPAEDDDEVSSQAVEESEEEEDDEDDDEDDDDDDADADTVAQDSGGDGADVAMDEDD